ncbi:sugar nucleotidyltransferase [Roseibium sp.]|uniref:sugar nucleotidyltransferase n=1 Tax=Roseibium sp. TaxID=1936156 RepID=UPI003BAE2AB8
MAEKGIILAGGTGSRLMPLTRVVCKQLLPLYDKPVICYPLSTLISMNITDILIISTPSDIGLFEKLFGDGADYGLKLSYAVQSEARGIAEALIIGEDFIGDDPVTLILGDNVLHYTDRLLFSAADRSETARATIYAIHVKDPRPFAVVEYDTRQKKVLSLEEKPEHPRSNYIAIGLYRYPPGAAALARTVEPSWRGELEITCLNGLYLEADRLDCVRLPRGAAWFDVGRIDTLLYAATYFQNIEQLQGLKVACLEEITYRRGLIDRQQFEKLRAGYGTDSEFGLYLDSVLRLSEETV